MAKAIHTMVRVLDLDRSIAFYREAFGLEVADRFDFDGFTLAYLRNAQADFEVELTLNKGRGEPYDLGDGYGHIALTVADLDGLLERLAEQGIVPERPPYEPGGRGIRICFVRDPDGYRVELIDGDFATPQDP